MNGSSFARMRSTSRGSIMPGFFAAGSHDGDVVHHGAHRNAAGAGEHSLPQVKLVNGAPRIQRVQQQARVAQLVEPRARARSWAAAR